MKRLLFAVFFFAVSVMTFAQGSIIKPVYDIAELEINDGDEVLTVFNMPEEGQNHYYLCLGTLGFGDDYVQLNIDPVFQLFIPLGGTLEEAVAKMEELKEVAKQESGTVVETVGTLAIGNPSMGEEETVYVTARRTLLRRLIEFSVKRNGYLRATYISKGELGSLISTVKIYRKLHPKEK